MSRFEELDRDHAAIVDLVDRELADRGYLPSGPAGAYGRPGEVGAFVVTISSGPTVERIEDAEGRGYREGFRDGGAALLFYLRRKLADFPDVKLADALPSKLFESLTIDTAGDLWRASRLTDDGDGETLDPRRPER